MHPASLVRRSGKDLVERLPEAERTVTNGDFRSDRQPPSFHIDEKFAPALRAFPNANLEADELLLALRRGPDQHQHAFAVVFHAPAGIHRRPTHTGIGAPTNPASANARTRLATPPSDGKSPPPTGSARPCPTAPPMPLRSLRSRCHADKGPAEAHPSSWSDVPTMAGSPR